MVIYQPKEGYCYNSDTIFLYDFVTNFELKGDVLDVGTGSGILALLIARDYPQARVSAIEMQEHFIQVAKINAQANKKDIQIYFGDFLHLIFEKKFDYIVTNPPFYHAGVVRSQNERIDKARYSGHLPLGDFLKKSAQILKPKGSLIFCYDTKQIQSVLAKLERYQFKAEVIRFVHPSAKKDASLAMIMAKKGSKALSKILPPLIVFGEDGKYQKSTEAIFKKVGVHSIKCEI